MKVHIGQNNLEKCLLQCGLYPRRPSQGKKNQQGYDPSRLFVLPEINKKKIVKNTFCFFQIEQIRETLIGKNNTSSKKSNWLQLNTSSKGEILLEILGIVNKLFAFNSIYSWQKAKHGSLA